MLRQSEDEQAVLQRTVFDGGFDAVFSLFYRKAGLWQFSLHLSVCFEDAVVDCCRLACMRDIDETRPVHNSSLCQMTYYCSSKDGIGVTPGEDGRGGYGGVLAELVADHLRA